MWQSGKKRSLRVEKSPAYPTDREHQKALKYLRFGAGTPVGLRPPYGPAPKRSHPVCRASLILIVALHPGYWRDRPIGRNQCYSNTDAQVWRKPTINGSTTATKPLMWHCTCTMKCSVSLLRFIVLWSNWAECVSRQTAIEIFNRTGWSYAKAGNINYCSLVQ